MGSYPQQPHTRSATEGQRINFNPSTQPDDDRDEDSIHVLATSPTLSANILQTARLREELLCLLLDPPFPFGPRRRLTNHRVPSPDSKFPDRARFGCPNRPDDDNINK
ncbi:Uncharacterized protein HZ326_5990 [Fusarium oxysporum f. sp. albedinis]|nr:Uncharacterized protein HZ326_5990 [Fusarium oxysporum f. sp. albedinis]